jgi:hypothetical protein
MSGQLAMMGIRSQSEEAQANRRGVRLDEKHLLLRKLRDRGLERVGWMFTFTAAAYNLVRMLNLMRGSPPPQCA